MPIRRVARRLNLLALSTLAAGALRAQDRVVHVISSDSQPIAYAFVQANGGRSLLTNEDGRVSLGSGKKQTLTLEVRRIGYAPFYGKVDMPDSAVTIPIVLAPLAQQLGSVRVSADKARSPLELSGFYRRWLAGQKGASSATFIGPEEIEKRSSSRISTLLSSVNGVNLSRTGNANLVVTSSVGGSCPMAIIVDGRQVCPTGGCDFQDYSHGLSDQNSVLIDQVISLNSVAGIEVYRRGSSMPSDFHVNGDCGAVVLWTGSRTR